MAEHPLLPWVALVGLGAFHGVNPGMGWLFAVAMGMQEKRRSAVYQALGPLALGHALSIAAAILLAAALNFVLPFSVLRPALAVVLCLFGISRMLRHRHFRWAGMRVGMGGLALWSFLMATAHGAGLMVAPFFLATTMMPDPHQHHRHAISSASAWTALAATGAHSAAYLAVTTLIAALVFEKFGVALLRRAWVNLDLVWAAAFVATGGLMFLI